MREIEDGTPVALYARVSSDRQDVDLSVARHSCGALSEVRRLSTGTASLSREYVDEAESGLHLPQATVQPKMLNDANAADDDALFGRFLCGSSRGSRAGASTPSPLSRC